MRTYRNLDRHQNLLNDVYATGKMSNELCIKHQVDKNTTRTLKDLKYITATGRSLISHKPSLQDVKKVIDKNRDRRYFLGKKKETQTKLVFGKDKKVAPVKVVTKKPTPKQTTPKQPKVQEARTTEINLFWGMIKIKR